MVGFRIVHLSDLHIAEHPDKVSHVDLSAKVRSTLAAINRWKNPLGMASHDARAARVLAEQLAREEKEKSLDAVLITGDLATTGFDKDLAAARDYLLGKQRCTPSIDLDIPCIVKVAKTIVMPGNHDRYQRGVPKYGPGRGHFENANCFGPRWRFSLPGQPKDDLGNAGGAVHSFHLRKSNVVLTVCCADFSLKPGEINPVEYLGKGDAHSDVVTELIRVTNASRQKYPGTGIVWAVHFPPEFNGLNKLLMLKNPQRLINAADVCKIEVLFAGHTHDSRDYDIPLSTHGLRVVAAGTTLEYNPGKTHLNFQYVELDVTATGQVRLQSVRRLFWREKAGAFS